MSYQSRAFKISFLLHGLIIAGRTGSGDTAGSGEGKESAEKKYLREHFAYIRDKILGHISYPPLARRMGWQGKVILSFVITTDGLAKEIKIVQGSGFSLLDKNAAETVSDTAPFPNPPSKPGWSFPSFIGWSKYFEIRCSTF
jgi:protein TonB